MEENLKSASVCDFTCVALFVCLYGLIQKVLTVLITDYNPDGLQAGQHLKKILTE